MPLVCGCVLIQNQNDEILHCMCASQLLDETVSLQMATGPLEIKSSTTLTKFLQGLQTLTTLEMYVDDLQVRPLRISWFETIFIILSSIRLFGFLNY